MRQVTRFCNRCGQAVIEGGSVLEVQAGDLRQRHPGPIDLCGARGDRFDEFLRSGHQANHDEPSEATDKGHVEPPPCQSEPSSCAV